MQNSSTSRCISITKIAFFIVITCAVQLMPLLELYAASEDGSGEKGDSSCSCLEWPFESAPGMGWSLEPIWDEGAGVLIDYRWSWPVVVPHPAEDQPRSASCNEDEGTASQLESGNLVVPADGPLSHAFVISAWEIRLFRCRNGNWDNYGLIREANYQGEQKDAQGKLTYNGKGTYKERHSVVRNVGIKYIRERDASALRYTDSTVTETSRKRKQVFDSIGVRYDRNWIERNRSTQSISSGQVESARDVACSLNESSALVSVDYLDKKLATGNVEFRGTAVLETHINFVPVAGFAFLVSSSEADRPRQWNGSFGSEIFNADAHPDMVTGIKDSYRNCKEKVRP